MMSAPKRGSSSKERSQLKRGGGGKKANGRVVFLEVVPIHLKFDTSTRARGYKTFFMLNSIEHKILIARKDENFKQEILHFSGSDKPRMQFFLCILVGILTFMSRKIS